MTETTSSPLARKIKIGFLSNWEFYVMLLPAIAVTFVFSYLPMYGLQIAFKTTRLGANYLNGEWIGFDNFIRFFNAGWFGIVMKNTILLSVVSYLITFPFTILLALMIFNSVNKRLAKFTQTFTYLPHLLSSVLVIGILNLFCNGETGLINILLRLMGQEAISFFWKKRFGAPDVHDHESMAACRVFGDRVFGGPEFHRPFHCRVGAYRWRE
ncbi:hypothetical protein [Cohnella rhizosphaerae]|uniref:Sugar ABC transporter permease n=1 Tax=Cohnella rhizosphaerae TaxID=1457232 RepID=A0A9X4QS67_9BACL|nr:hypothetical protein [Cohnella rhizosphaerae]MDG0808212.1 hypothetical protein [Cohnella rhizosphaerae]